VALRSGGRSFCSGGLPRRTHHISPLPVPRGKEELRDLLLFHGVQAAERRRKSTIGIHNQLQAIVDDKSETRFETVMAVFDRAGGELDKISMVFSNLTSSLNTPELQTVQTERTSASGSSATVLL
jgi:hypothetical protein